MPDVLSYNHVACAGTESTLDACTHDITDDAGPTDGAGVVCGKTVFTLSGQVLKKLPNYVHDCAEF